MMKGIYAALAKAQSEMGKAIKESANPHFRSKYADLGNVMDACLPALNANGIAVVQPFVPGELGHVVKTILYHESGESIECSVPLLLGKQDMQGLGSAITYARRYGLMSMAGIAPEDDDGNGAAKNPPNKTQQGLQDAWRDAVLDSLPEDASPRQKAEAFAEAIVAGFREKKEKALENEWERRKKLIAEFESRYPDLHERVVDAYERRVMLLQEGEAA